MQKAQKVPVKFHALLIKFNQSVNWNAFFYIAYKISFTSLSLTLYKRLTTNDYATWANINSIVYLILLWLDCGLRKSIPRFSPELTKNSHHLKRFIVGIIVYQFCLLLIALPLFTHYAPAITTRLHLTSQSTFCLFGPALLITEGLIAILRLLFHAHFWNKQFNGLATAALIVEIILDFFLICSSLPSTTILNAILLIKIILSGIVTLISIPMLNHLIKKTAADKNGAIQMQPLIGAFIKHSGIMWANNNLKSLSERNFLTPFLTYTLGPVHANLFKVINEGALLFHRTVIKTIGTTDTALLAHVETSQESKMLLPIAFKKLTTKIAALCLPLLGILGLLFLLMPLKQENAHFAFQAFLIITIGYLSETLLSPYERVLEVKQRYWLLIYAYIPYIIILALMLCSSLITYIGLIDSLIIIHGVRLVSSLINAYFARKNYTLKYPFESVWHNTSTYTYVPMLILIYVILEFTIAQPYKDQTIQYIIDAFTPQ